jgi:hypothetical protein
MPKWYGLQGLIIIIIIIRFHVKFVTGSKAMQPSGTVTVTVM